MITWPAYFSLDKTRKKAKLVTDFCDSCQSWEFELDKSCITSMTSMVNLNIMNPELRDPSRRIRRASEAVGKVELNLGIRLVHRRRLLSLDDTHTVRCRRV